ncbi:hypothetical protein, partial [Phenylobacterium sp.]|uniref:hypothetical protein n=1 Tax=Phenylobacterium sp. TaxID=1871053 RepID=UPI0028A2C7B2
TDTAFSWWVQSERIEKYCRTGAAEQHPLSTLSGRRSVIAMQRLAWLKGSSLHSLSFTPENECASTHQRQLHQLPEQTDVTREI